MSMCHIMRTKHYKTINYEKFCIKLSSILTQPKHFLSHNHIKNRFGRKLILLKNLFVTFFVGKCLLLILYCTKNIHFSIGNHPQTTIKTTHKEPCNKFSKLFGHPKIFYRHFKKNFSKKTKISVISLKLTFCENFKPSTYLVWADRPSPLRIIKFNLTVGGLVVELWWCGGGEI
ncbi:hypothetical protein AGLY_002271 [Aphis glycines]|uniref:Uncharacterized protein n=1 Tax=Aphis glycines TaxID=307491 RepID=A0A6G0U2X5_APHGL|nr:hypothetical protein AGLY_002271 [Aphis glycines]